MTSDVSMKNELKVRLRTPPNPIPIILVSMKNELKAVPPLRVRVIINWVSIKNELKVARTLT